jgi:hypothetical protein
MKPAVRSGRSIRQLSRGVDAEEKWSVDDPDSRGPFAPVLGPCVVGQEPQSNRTVRDPHLPSNLPLTQTRFDPNAANVSSKCWQLVYECIGGAKETLNVDAIYEYSQISFRSVVVRCVEKVLK